MTSLIIKNIGFSFLIIRIYYFFLSSLNIALHYFFSFNNLHLIFLIIKNYYLSLLMIKYFALHQLNLLRFNIFKYLIDSSNSGRNYTKKIRINTVTLCFKY